MMGDNFESVAGDQLRAFIERIERLEEEIKSINDDKKEVYAEAKGNGFDTKVIKKVIAIRRQDHNERMEQEAILELYLSALGMAPATDYDDDFEPPSRARAPARTREPVEHDADGVVTNDEEISAKAPASKAVEAVSAAEEINETPMSNASVKPGGADPVTTDDAASAGETATVYPGGENANSVGNADAPHASLRSGGAEAARLAHNQEVAGASPAPATISETDIPVSTEQRATLPAQTEGRETSVAQSAAPTPQALAGAAVARSGDSVDPSAVPAVRRPGDVWTEHTPPEPVVWHDYARCFPEHWGMALADLADSIRADGVREPIVKIGNQILDGRARYTTARGLLIDYPVTEYDGSDPLLDVIRWNLEARKLGANERKLIATKLIKLCPDRGEEITSAFGLDHGRAAAE